VENGWLDRPAMAGALKGTRFKFKLILYVLAMPRDYAAQYPAERMVDENGATDRHLGRGAGTWLKQPWEPGERKSTS